MDDSEADQRLEHQMDPPQPVDMDTVTKLTGVLYWKVYCLSHLEGNKSLTFLFNDIFSLVLHSSIPRHSRRMDKLIK